MQRLEKKDGTQGEKAAQHNLKWGGPIKEKLGAGRKRT